MTVDYDVTMMGCEISDKITSHYPANLNSFSLPIVTYEQFYFINMKLIELMHLNYILNNVVIGNVPLNNES